MAEMNKVTIEDMAKYVEMGYKLIINDGNIVGLECVDNNGEKRYIF